MNIRLVAVKKLMGEEDFYYKKDGTILPVNPVSVPSESEIQAKIAELEAEEPLRLLRLERNRLLQETDWEITRGLEEGLNIDSLKTYRTSLRNLPQQIEAGEITAPTLNDNGMLVFEHWPERTDA